MQVGHVVNNYCLLDDGAFVNLPDIGEAVTGSLVAVFTEIPHSGSLADALNQNLTSVGSQLILRVLLSIDYRVEDF